MKALSSGFWKTDWFLGALIVVLVIIFNRASDLIPSLERKAYDLGVRATSREPARCWRR
jgi:serine/threonine-protein kinase